MESIIVRLEHASTAGIVRGYSERFTTNLGVIGWKVLASVQVLTDGQKNKNLKNLALSSKFRKCYGKKKFFCYRKYYQSFAVVGEQ
jgi:hypothetical protein